MNYWHLLTTRLHSKHCSKVDCTQFENGIYSFDFNRYYPNGNYGGQRNMTRYEMATVIYRALQKGIAVNNRIVAEFKPELERIRVDQVTSNIERVRVIEGRG